jgi:hypothetical protein
MSYDPQNESDKRDQDSALPYETVLHEVQSPEYNRRQQNARKNAQRIDHDRLDEAAEKQFLNNRPESNSEQ